MRTCAWLCAAGLFLGVFSAPAAHGETTWYVDDDASTGGNGVTWTTAYKYLQDALAAAQAGDGIHVAGGTYTPDRDEAGNVTSGDRYATFPLVFGAEVSGGYAGLANTTNPDLRDIEVYQSVLSGDLNGDDGPDFTNNDENSYHVVTGNGTIQTAILDGFTITAGNANNGAYPYDHLSGAGMYLAGDSPTVINCTFRANSADSSGGGMYSDWSLPTLTNCVFSENIARSGGGLEIYAGGHQQQVLTNCRFVGNSADYGGGIALYEHGYGDVAINNCMFSGNFATYEGGAIDVYFIEAGFKQTVTNCTFSGNTTGGRAGGIYVRGGLILTNSVLWGNSDSQGTNESAQVYPGWWATISYSCIQGLSGKLGGVGNIGDDPLFVDPTGPDGVVGTVDDNLRLMPGSPAIDACDVNYYPGFGAIDLDGNPRLLDGNGDGWAFVDIGAYEFLGVSIPDCNANGIPDSIDIAAGNSADCNINGIPDECEPDCNGNNVEDSCDIGDGTSHDCNGNGIPDDCDIAAGNSEDCNQDGIPDECAAGAGTGEDCNENGITDECDISGGTSEDCDSNAIPDDCEPDDDEDGLINVCDGCPNDPNKIEPGICGCAVVDDDTDSDGDGFPDCVDQCPDVDDSLFAPSCEDAIPTLSAWGLAVLTLLLLVAGKVYFARRHEQAA